MSKRTKTKEEHVSDFLDEEYRNADNKEELDYWAPLSKLIMESVTLRDRRDMTQADLAQAMGTTQSVISRFENMGRVPNYDFIARMAIALGHIPGMTLTGDFMYTVPAAMQDAVSQAAEQDGKSTQEYLRRFLNEKLQEMELQNANPNNLIDFFREISNRIKPGITLNGDIDQMKAGMAAFERLAQ